MKVGRGAGSGNGSRPIHVLVVDDSAVVRQVMTGILSSEPGVLVTVAADPYIAMSKLALSRPDVILLDLQMPRMDGMTFLRKIMAEDPLPVVVCSALTGRATETALRALEEGAVDVVAKPKLGVSDFLKGSRRSLIETLRAAAGARVVRRGATAPAPPRGPAGRHTVMPPRLPAIATERVVAIGASTGGTEALRVLLEALPPDAPGLIIVQHMPQVFTSGFAQRLDQTCRVEVKEASEGDRILRGRALIAPGNRHTTVVRNGARYVVQLSDGPPVSRHRPSVDVLFRSVAQAAGPNALGVIMTGMGADGAAGLLRMREAGAYTIAQDEESCVVFGMPKEAIALGAAHSIAPLSEIPGLILKAAGAGLDAHDGDEATPV